MRHKKYSLCATPPQHIVPPEGSHRNTLGDENAILCCPNSGSTINIRLVSWVLSQPMTLVFIVSHRLDITVMWSHVLDGAPLKTHQITPAALGATQPKVWTCAITSWRRFFSSFSANAKLLRVKLLRKGYILKAFPGMRESWFDKISFYLGNSFVRIRALSSSSRPGSALYIGPYISSPISET